MHMAHYIAGRLQAVVPVLLLVSVIVFAGVRFIPGDECFVILRTTEYSTAQCDRIRAGLGLDRPFLVQYFDWLLGVLRGDFGTSFVTNQDALQQIRSRMYATAELALLASTFAAAIGIPVGMISAVKHNTAIDHLSRILMIGWLSLPSFWVATVMIVFLSNAFGYSPPVGYAGFLDDPVLNLEQMLLPAISLGLAISASLARLTRSSMLEVLREDYIRTAHAKGMRRNTVISRHALRNALLPVVTLFGLQLGTLLGGTVVLESIFGLPGLGTLLLSSVTIKDYVQVQAIVLLFAIIVILISLIVDLSYAWLDPRIKFG
jgi:peptide/nickel transport system permease protein